MESLHDALIAYLNSWIECSNCSEMVQASNMTSNNEDQLICIDCEDDGRDREWNEIND
jgi:formylmethanofuran dehydrogenase subunit E